MRTNDVYVRGTGVCLPARRRVGHAIAAGEVDLPALAGTDVASVSIAPKTSAPDLAVTAAAQALERASSGPADVGLILHADTYHQGQDLWPVASYIQHETLGNSCSAIELRQMSNGGIAALDLAVSQLQAGSDRPDVLITTADRFCQPGIDRWRTDPGTPYGDGGTALVLSRRPGFARLRSIAIHADSELEAMHRGDEPWTDCPFEDRMPVDFEAAKKAFVRDHGLSFAISRSALGQRCVVDRAAAEAGIELSDVHWFAIPHFGARRLQSCFFEPFRIEKQRTVWEWSRTIGHLGAGDQFASLNQLAITGMLKPGDICVLISVGAGFSWGCAVLEIVAPPQWGN